MKPHAKKIFWNAMLLSAASLLMRTAGVGFQVYVSGRAGAEAMGLYSLLSGVYGFALTLATSGIHLGVTRVVVDAVGTGKSGKVKPVMRRAVLYSLLFGTAASALLAGSARYVGIHWLKDARTVSSLRLLAVTLPAISLSSAFGGYFTAVRRPYKNAAVQVTEQAIRIGCTMYLLPLMLPGGVERTCCAMVLGGVLGEVLSFLAELILYLFDRRRYPADPSETGRAEGRKLMKITLPIALTTYLRSGLITLEHILIPEGLRNSGSSHASALIAYGYIHSMALPVILYPAALIGSFSGLLVPELAESALHGTFRHTRYMIARVWGLSLLFSIGVAGVLVCFSGELGEALYPGTEAGRYIRILAPLVPIMYVDTATDAMMKGLGEQVFSMNINIADALISVILVWILVPRTGINGYLITIYVSETFNTVLSITHLLSISKAPVRIGKWIYKPLLCVLAATFGTRFLLELSGGSVAVGGLSVALHCGICAVLYLLLLCLTGTVEKEDLRWIRSLFRREKPPQTQKKEKASDGVP